MSSIEEGYCFPQNDDLTQTPSKEAIEAARSLRALLATRGLSFPSPAFELEMQSAITYATAPLEQRMVGLENEISDLKRERDDLKKQLTTQQKALEFYGDEKNWTSAAGVTWNCKIDLDRGALARAALERRGE
jgi:hypothetical protein